MEDRTPQTDGATSPVAQRARAVFSEQARADFSRRLRLAFERSGLTQIELAKAIGGKTKQATVSDWMNPKKEAIPSTPYLFKLAKLLGVSADRLLFGEQASNLPATSLRAYRDGGIAAITEAQERLELLRKVWFKEGEPTPPAPEQGPSDAISSEDEQQALPARGRRRKPRRSRPA